ncbi:hypothetical protein HWI79_502 [Cryptosporidium felis]|nr:hypothetical protein HWI79_502 [Cryptosporidium felis]
MSGKKRFDRGMKRSIAVVLGCIFGFAIGMSKCSDSSLELDSYSALTVNPSSSQRLLDIVAHEAVPSHGEKKLLNFEEGLATQHVIEKINSYIPKNLEVAERYAANLVAISKLREEIYMDSKEYFESVKSQLEMIPESAKLKETLKASEEKMKKSEANYLSSKKAAERALNIYMSFIRPTSENAVIKAEATEGKGLKIAHKELSNMESISLPDMDTSGYEPLDADASLMSIGESVLPPEETKESLINKALDKISANIEDDFSNNNSPGSDKSDKKKLVMEQEKEDETKKGDLENKMESLTLAGNSEDIFGSSLAGSNADLINNDYESEDMGMSESSGGSQLVQTSIPSSVSASFPSAIDNLAQNKKIIVIPVGASLNGKVPDYLQYAFRRSYILAYLASVFVEAYVLPQFFTENPVIKLYSIFRISKKTFISHILFGLASRYRILFKDLKRLPFVHKDTEMKDAIGKIVLELSTTGLLLLEALKDSDEGYKSVAELLVEFPFNVKEVFSKFSAPIRENYPKVDYSFIMDDCIYSAPKTFFPDLTSEGINNLKLFDKEISEKLEEVDVKKSLGDLKESQLWIKDYVLRNAAYKHHQFENNQFIRPYFDFSQFGICLVPQVEEILKKSLDVHRSSNE